MGKGTRFFIKSFITMTIGNKNAQKYNEIHKDEIKYYFDILQNNSIDMISEITGYGRNFIQITLNGYK